MGYVNTNTIKDIQEKLKNYKATKDLPEDAVLSLLKNKTTSDKRTLQIELEKILKPKFNL